MFRFCLRSLFEQGPSVSFRFATIALDYTKVTAALASVVIGAIFLVGPLLLK